MIKKSFVSFSQQWLAYEKITDACPEPASVSPSGRATLFFGDAYTQHASTLFSAGDKVQRGQKLRLYEDRDTYAVSPVTGTVAAIAPTIGDMNRSLTEVAIDAEGEDTFDEQFAAAAESPSLDVAREYLATAPGLPPLDALADTERPIDTIVICGLDSDLLLITAAYTMMARLDAVKKGIHILKDIADVDKILVVVPRDSIQGYGHLGADMVAVSSKYPSGHPLNIMRTVLDREVPAGKQPEDLGVCFMGVEAVAAIGEAFESGQVPDTKTLTFIDKDGRRAIVEARIGTPLRDLFNTLDVTVADGDRIIFGGPMTGKAVYSEDQPIGPDTDAVILQAGADIPVVSDTPCINCGDCIRVCPANIPINLLVRFLEAGQYEEAADLYDLHACIECGLCSYVCVSKIPVFQYIKLGKYELEQTRAAEESND